MRVGRVRPEPRAELANIECWRQSPNNCAARTPSADRRVRCPPGWARAPAKVARPDSGNVRAGGRWDDMNDSFMSSGDMNESFMTSRTRSQADFAGTLPGWAPHRGRGAGRAAELRAAAGPGSLSMGDAPVVHHAPASIQDEL